MHRLIAKEPENAERIFPYIGGEEVNDSPDACAPSLRNQLRRYDRGGGAAVAGLDRDRRGEGEARRIAGRIADPGDEYWWQIREIDASLINAIRRTGRVLGHRSRSANSFRFAFLPAIGLLDTNSSFIALDILQLLHSSDRASTKSGHASSRPR